MPQEVLYYDDFLFKIPDEIVFKKTHEGNGEDASNKDEDGHENKAWQKNLENLLHSYKDFSKDKHLDFQKHFVDGKNKAQIDNAVSKLEGHLNKKITDKWRKILPSNSTIKEIILKREEDEKTARFILEVKDTKKTLFRLAERSKGCRWFFSFMFYTEFQRHGSKNVVFLLDEPASYLHASSQEKVMEAINKLTKGPSGASVIYTTHSPYLLDMENMEAIFLVKNKGRRMEMATPSVEVTQFLDEKQETEKGPNDSFRPILDYLLFKLPSVIEASVIEEGKYKKATKSDGQNKFTDEGKTVCRYVQKSQAFF